jgi:hypothetical protein
MVRGYEVSCKIGFARFQHRERARQFVTEVLNRMSPVPALLCKKFTGDVVPVHRRLEYLVRLSPIVLRSRAAKGRYPSIIQLLRCQDTF